MLMMNDGPSREELDADAAYERMLDRQADAAFRNAFERDDGLVAEMEAEEALSIAWGNGCLYCGFPTHASEDCPDVREAAHGR